MRFFRREILAQCKEEKWRVGVLDRALVAFEEAKEKEFEAFERGIDERGWEQAQRPNAGCEWCLEDEEEDEVRDGEEEGDGYNGEQREGLWQEEGEGLEWWFNRHGSGSGSETGSEEDMIYVDKSDDFRILGATRRARGELAMVGEGANEIVMN